MPAPMLIGAGIQAAAGIAQTVSGIINAARTKKLAKELERTRPQYQISQLAKDDLSLTESELANGGLSARAETAYNNLNNQQFATSLNAILKGGGSVNNVADVYGGNQEGASRLALLNDQMRLAKIQNVLKVRDMYRDEQGKEFEFNDWRPWADKSQANAAARQQAQNQIWGGINSIAGAGMNYFGGKAQEQQYDKYFGNGGGQVESMPNGQQMWDDWKRQQIADNSAQGNYTLPQKFSTQGQNSFYIPPSSGMSDYQNQGLYNYLHRGR